jgi:hypothetical protein
VPSIGTRDNYGKQHGCGNWKAVHAAAGHDLNNRTVVRQGVEGWLGGGFDGY